MIHDGARPLITLSILEEGLKVAQRHLAAVAAVRVKDTIKEVHDGLIHGTVDRSSIWAVQTPQIFDFSLILQVHHSPLAAEEATDDGILVEQLGRPVAIFEGSYSNLKITTPEDLLIAEVLIRSLSSSEKGSDAEPAGGVK